MFSVCDAILGRKKKHFSVFACFSTDILMETLEEHGAGFTMHCSKVPSTDLPQESLGCYRQVPGEDS